MSVSLPHRRSDPELALDHPALREDALFDGMEESRQHVGGRLPLTMVPQVGQAIDIHEVDRLKMREVMRQVAEFAGSRETAAVRS